MSAETFLNGRIVLHCGDSRDVLKTLPDNSIDSFVTDPPYALVSIVKRFGGKNAAAVKVPDGGSGAYSRASAGFMGKSWDTGETAFAVEFWAECLRVLKPGGHVVAFSGTRTYHRMVVAIEDAGFEVRDMLQWLYGSGFPKSHDVSKGIDRAAGAEREVIGTGTAYGRGSMRNKSRVEAGYRPTELNPDGGTADVTAPATEAAQRWEGWGTALKPANEPIVLARKPLSEGTVAANVLRWGTGAINIDGCRVQGETWASSGSSSGGETVVAFGDGLNNSGRSASHQQGRWPANVITDGSEEVVELFPDAPGQQQDIAIDAPSAKTGNIYGKMNRRGEKSADSRYADKGSTNFAALPGMRRGDAGSAARYFYAAKADADDRIGSKHPTIKPVDLMQWLCRLVTPPGGTVLDPFSGTGTTGEAAFREGFNAVLIEREPEYQTDIRRRMALCMAGPEERKRESIKAKGGDQPFEAGSLFAVIGAAEAAE